MKAITIYPEWVFAITYLGKNAENRPWDPTRRGLAVGERFALHAGKYVGGRPGIEVKREAVSGLMFMAERAGWIVTDIFGDYGLDFRAKRNGREVVFRVNDIVRSAVVAVTTLADVCRDSLSPWAVSRQYHWELTDLVVLPEPVPCRGNRMLWDLPADVEIAVSRQLNAVSTAEEEEF